MANNIINTQKTAYNAFGNLTNFSPPPIVAEGPPHPYDIAIIGSIWIDNRVGVNKIYIESGIFQGNAIWVEIGGFPGDINTITTNNGVAVPVANNVNLFTANSTPIFAAVGATITLDFNATSNLALGSSLPALTTAIDNVCFGSGAGAAITSGGFNSLIGFNAGNTITTGQFNSVLGDIGLNTLTTGSYNLALGAAAGGNYNGAESSNVMIANAGIRGESNVMRIGTTGVGVSEVNTTYIAGVYGVAPTHGGNLSVIIDNTGQLGTSGSAGVTSWVNVTGSTQALAVNTGYVDSYAAGLCTMTLPAVAAFGQIIRVVGSQAGNQWQIAQNAGQSIAYQNAVTTIGVTGYLQSTNINDTVELLCTVANTGFTVISGVGNITVH